MTGLSADLRRLHFIVTGGAGFIGSHMVDLLLESYPTCIVTCVDKLSYASGFLLDNLSKARKHENFRFIKLDLSESPEALTSILVQNRADFGPVAVFNFAAESCVDQSFADPLFFTKNNIFATQNLLEAFRRVKDQDPAQFCKFSMVHISTDEVYGEQEANKNVSETASLHPSNPYAATKAACDLLVEAYVKSYKLPVSVVRANNIYGPRQYPEKLIAVTLNRLRHAHPKDGLRAYSKIQIHGDGSNKRKYLHVGDFVRAVELVWRKTGENHSFGETFNVGSPDEWANLDLVKHICQKYMRDVHQTKITDFSDFVECGQDRLYNDARYSIDLTKMRELGWRPEVSFDAGIGELIRGMRGL